MGLTALENQAGKEVFTISTHCGLCCPSSSVSTLLSHQPLYNKTHDQWHSNHNHSIKGLLHCPINTFAFFFLFSFAKTTEYNFTWLFLADQTNIQSPHFVVTAVVSLAFLSLIFKSQSSVHLFSSFQFGLVWFGSVWVWSVPSQLFIDISKLI